MKKKVCVIFGGESTEYEISLKSAYSILQNINKDKYDVITIGITRDGKWYLYDGSYDLIPENKWYNETLRPVSIMHGCKKPSAAVFNGDSTYTKIDFDIAFPVLHGINGEDGTIQGLFELAGIKYVGTGVITSCIGMDKTFAKIVFKNEGINQADWVVIEKYEMPDIDKKIAEIESELGYPVFIKPANAGSSIGIGKAKNRDELVKAVNEAFKIDKKVLVEEFLKGHEVECAVLGNKGNIKASCVGEIVASQDFYTYDAKYSGDCPSTLYIPAKISEKHSEEVRKGAVKAFNALDGKGLSRVDFFVDDENDKVYINEINTMPGFTNISMYPKLFEASGIKYSELIDKLIEIGFED